MSPFGSDKIIDKGRIDAVKKLLDKYLIKDMNDWKDVNADLIITDSPYWPIYL